MRATALSKRLVYGHVQGSKKTDTWFGLQNDREPRSRDAKKAGKKIPEQRVVSAHIVQLIWDHMAARKRGKECLEGRVLKSTVGA